MAVLKIWPWSKIFDHLTMTPGHRPNGKKSSGNVPLAPSYFLHSNFYDLVTKNADL